MSVRHDLPELMAGAECSDAEIGRMWAHVAQRLPGSRQRWRLPLGIALAAATGSILFVAVHALHRERQVVAHAGTVCAPIGRRQRVLLGDGSHVDVAPGARLRIAADGREDVALALEAGEARFEVTRRPGRRFSVSAGHMTVTVIGTQFKVGVGKPAAGSPLPVHVEVAHGVVRVAIPGREPWALHAGESWTGVDDASGPAPSVVPIRSSEAEPPAASAPSAPSVPPAPPAGAASIRRPAAPPGDTPLRRRAALLSRADDRRESDARELFDEADRAWVDGRPAVAARAFDEVRRRFPGHPTSALAALQLGRIRLDALDDPRGAVAALTWAGARLADASLREDAQARIVEAWDRAGDVSACREARARYLDRYPQGRWREAVKRRCGAGP